MNTKRSVIMAQHLRSEHAKVLAQQEDAAARQRADIEAPLRDEIDRLRAALATAQDEREAEKAQVTRLTSELAFVRNEAAGFNMAWAFALERVEAERDEWHTRHDEVIVQCGFGNAKRTIDALTASLARLQQERERLQGKLQDIQDVIDSDWRTAGLPLSVLGSRMAALLQPTPPTEAQEETR